VAAALGLWAAGGRAGPLLAAGLAAALAAVTATRRSTSVPNTSRLEV